MAPLPNAPPEEALLLVEPKPLPTAVLPPNKLPLPEPPNPLAGLLCPNRLVVPVLPPPKPEVFAVLLLAPKPPLPKPLPAVAVLLPKSEELVEAAEPKAGFEAPKPELEVPKVPVIFDVRLRSYSVKTHVMVRND